MPGFTDTLSLSVANASVEFTVQQLHAQAPELRLEITRIGTRRSRLSATTLVRVTVSGEPDRISDLQEGFNGSWGYDDLIGSALIAAQSRYRRLHRRRVARAHQ